MIEFKLNGESQKIDVDPQMPILWVVRDVLGKTGTKFGCGKGLCGACTVHLNGSAIRSCSTPIIAASSSEITTIEGLQKDKKDHPLQEAWVKHNVPQCGYCQPGQLMQAASLLTQNTKPSDEDIASNMAGNICRCGTYQRIKSAIKDAAKQMRGPA
ncbi:(2Fe-2S)-binding protein [Oligoflexaceae bacterium]|nr:(2Fe-2S)-binding protein [Oligoflexaceae bacterium]